GMRQLFRGTGGAPPSRMWPYLDSFFRRRSSALLCAISLAVVPACGAQPEGDQGSSGAAATKSSYRTVLHEADSAVVDARGGVYVLTGGVTGKSGNTDVTLVTGERGESTQPIVHVDDGIFRFAIDEQAFYYTKYLDYDGNIYAVNLDGSNRDHPRTLGDPRI